ncbi:MAG: arginase family protein [Tuberibacillus sp.]
MNLPVTIYNLDESLLMQKNLLKPFQHQVIDCIDIQGKNLYCTPQAFQDIRARYLTAEKRHIAFIGSGNYHYVTYLHLSQITHPFTLVLFDHHTDLMENADFMTCGSWVTRALRELPQLKKAIIVGPDPKTFDTIPLDLQDRVALVPEDWEAKKIINHFYSLCETDSIYISIDKDVLDKTFAKTNWDHGRMDLHTLLKCLSELTANVQVDGVDICGEWLVSLENAFTPSSRINIQKNEKANLAILGALTAGRKPINVRNKKQYLKKDRQKSTVFIGA